MKYIVGLIGKLLLRKNIYTKSLEEYDDIHDFVLSLFTSHILVHYSIVNSKMTYICLEVQC